MSLPPDFFNWVQASASIATLLGVLAAVLFFPANARKARRAEEVELVEGANKPFRRFLELQLEYPGLGFETACSRDVFATLSDDDKIRQRVMAEYLMSVMEAAYYVCERGKAPLGEWPVWAAWFTHGYARNPNFRRWWAQLESQGVDSYGEDFLRAMHKILSKADAHAA